MPHVTEHTPKVSTRSVKPYARESSREKRQQDRRSDRQTHRRIVQNRFSRRFVGCTSHIRSYLEVDFSHDASTSIDKEVKEVFATGEGEKQFERVELVNKLGFEEKWSSLPWRCRVTLP